jgi:hypothetical protein
MRGRRLRPPPRTAAHRDPCDWPPAVPSYPRPRPPAPRPGRQLEPNTHEQTARSERTLCHTCGHSIPSCPRLTPMSGPRPHPARDLAWLGLAPIGRMARNWLLARRPQAELDSRADQSQDGGIKASPFLHRWTTESANHVSSKSAWSRAITCKLPDICVVTLYNEAYSKVSLKKYSPTAAR